MTIILDALAAVDSQDANLMEKLLHEEFLFVDDYNMKTTDEWLVTIRELFKEKSLDFTNKRRIVADTRDLWAMEYEREIDGKIMKITNVSLLKDGKFWRSFIHRVPV